ncbi:hypothetical protein Peur_033058 [Populus x canadensis]
MEATFHGASNPLAQIWRYTGLRENPSRISLTTSPQPGRSPVKTKRTSWVKTTGPTRIHPVGIEVRLTVLDSKEKATLVGFVQV